MNVFRKLGWIYGATMTLVCSAFGSPVFFSFQEGVNGYAGTLDIQLRQSAPDTPEGTNQVVTADRDPGEAQALLQFSNIFGSNLGQIPHGIPIASATLYVFQTDPGDPVNAYRMLMPWDATNTWNSFANGVQADDVEAIVTPDFTIESSTNGLRSFDVTAAVQDWSDSSYPNFGWVFISTGGNGWSWASSESAVTNQRPRLVILAGGHPQPCRVTVPASITIVECETLTIASSISGDCRPPLRFQWFKNGTAIPSETYSSYVKPQAEVSDNGSYYIVVSNDFGSATSSVCTVTISPDIVGPTVVGVTGDPDLVHIHLKLSEAMERLSAENTSNYVLRTTSGASFVISNAVLSPDELSVLLTTAPRAFQQSYSLTIQNLRDTSCYSNGPVNVINPNPTVVGVHSDAWRLLAWDDVWRYEHNTNLDSTDWQTANYDDWDWPLGQGLFGFEFSQATLATLPKPIQTMWTISPDQPTYYVRTLLRVPQIDPEGVLFQVRHITDDGLVVHANGAEAFRFNMTSQGPITFSSLALSNGEARLETNYVTLNIGTNLLAAEVHQASTNSGDILFGAEVIAIALPPFLSVRLHEGSIRLEWTPRAGTLEESSDFVNWNASANQTSPQLRSPSSQPAFFRIRR